MEARPTSVPFDALRAMLAEHPDAWVAAVDSSARFVPIPDGVPLRGHRRLVGRWALDHVVHADRSKLAAAWRGRIGGFATAECRLITGGVATYHVFDLTAELGVDVVVALADDEADLAAVADAEPDGAASRFCRIIRDASGRTIEIDDAAPSVLRYSREDLLTPRPPLERIHADDHGTMISCWMATLERPTVGHRCRVRAIRGDGTLAWFEITNFNRLADPERPHVITEMLDISEEMAALDALAAREQLLHRLAEALPLGVIQVDVDGAVVYANDRLVTVLGETGPVRTLDALVEALAVDDRARLVEGFERSLAAAEDDDLVLHGQDGRILRITIKSLPGTGAVACVADVTEATLMGRELERRATYDDLTGCLNRSTILDRLDDAVRRPAGGSAVIFVDLDGFKGVNDRCGHAVGDEVLKVAASVLMGSTRAGDDVGRLGGDEFLVVCRDVPDGDEAMRLAQRISDALLLEPLVRDAAISLRASIGVAWSAAGSATAEDLVERADAAMYQSKRAASGAPVSA